MATSKLQRFTGDLLDQEFPQFTIRENFRPDWMLSSNLTKLELDFFIEELNIGIEVQGLQHYEYIPWFYKDVNDFEKRKQYDKEKQDLCVGKGVKLIEIASEMDIQIFVYELKESLCKNLDNKEELENRKTTQLEKIKYKVALKKKWKKEWIQIAKELALQNPIVCKSQSISLWIQHNHECIDSYLNDANNIIISIYSLLDSDETLIIPTIDSVRRIRRYLIPRGLLANSFTNDNDFIKQVIYKYYKEHT